MCGNGERSGSVLNSTEHDIISHMKKTQMLKTMPFLALKLLKNAFILLINVKMPTIVGILTFMSRINFKFSGVEHEKSCLTSRPG